MGARANSSSGVPLRLWRVSEVAKLCNVSTVTVRRWVTEGRLQSQLVNGQRRFRQADVFAIIGRPQHLLIFSSSVSVSAKRRYPGLPVVLWDDSTVDKVLGGELDGSVLVTEDKNSVGELLSKILASRAISVVPVVKRRRSKGDKSELADYLNSERPTYAGYLEFAKSPVSEKAYGIAKRAKVASQKPPYADPVEALIAFSDHVRKCRCNKTELWRKYVAWCETTGNQMLARQRVLNTLDSIRS